MQVATLMPFTRDAFFAVFAAYNEAFWPMALALWLLTFAAVAGWALCTPRGESFLRFVLGVNWLWSGVAYPAIVQAEGFAYPFAPTQR